MQKNKIPSIFIFFFLSMTVFASVYLTKKTQILQKFAKGGPVSTTFSIFPSKSLNRIWPNFAQGGESQEPMLKPAEEQIKLLQPSYIRLDHIFDFPDLDKRVEEIIALGARPFLSLSYFPPSVSTDLTVFPPSLAEWQKLVQATIQKYSGKDSSNLLDVYYEVWNEPDLFGKMPPEQYFSLYQASVAAAAACQNCNYFKIGGPAITTLKKDWMEKFLSLAGQNNLRMDFVSWHSYQLNPNKTLWEAQTLKGLRSFQRYFSDRELVISEWGSVPEVSPLHDSYFDASHTVWAIDKLTNSVDKIFTFELVDGPNPEGKKFWGRWGLLTNQSFGLTPKPRYFPYLFLGKLLNLETEPQEISPNLTAIGSTDGKENYTILLARSEGKSGIVPAELTLSDVLPGVYNINTYLLDSNHNPLFPQNKTQVSSGGLLTLSNQLAANAVALVEINRASPALIPAQGRSSLPDDSSAKISSALPPLVFFLNSAAEIKSLKADFWFKISWDSQEKQTRIIFENSNTEGRGVTAWFEETNNQTEIYFGAFDHSAISEQVKISFLPEKDMWYHLVFQADKANKTLSLMFNDQQATVSLPDEIPFGNLIYFGSSGNRTNYAEGFIDDLVVETNSQVLYEKNFN